MTIPVRQRFYGYTIDVTGKKIHGTASLLHFICSIVPSRQYDQGFQVGVAKEQFPFLRHPLRLRKARQSFISQLLGLTPCPFPIEPMTSQILISVGPNLLFVTKCDVSIACCLFIDVVVPLPCKYGHHHQHSSR